MKPDQFKSEMISLLPRLRRFALSLTKSVPDADDLLQDACTTA
jgi:RNA polymerase sigma-70 factor (ECF subfamily)